MKIGNKEQEKVERWTKPEIKKSIRTFSLPMERSVDFLSATTFATAGGILFLY